MARYGTSIVSQTAILAGMPSGTTVNGYVGYWYASATAGFKLRRAKVGIRTTSASVPTSQQVTLELHRQTVLPLGTGLSAAVLGEAFEIHTPADPTTGFVATTATTIGTSGPTLNTQALATLTFNTQSMVDCPWEFLEEIVCNKATSNGIAIVNIGNALPATHLFTIDFEIEV